ncbi:MAG: lysylphosphatidylglycerol synthase domain-containing protein [Beijerinckiaceae bacterium]
MEPSPLPAPGRRNFKIIGTIASLGLFAVSVVVLTIIVRELDAAEIRAALAAASQRQILLALLFTALSYVLLTGYDALGFRQLGLKPRYRITALGSFTSYAVSFTLGFPLITAGTVRYWIYSSIGISARAIASLTLIAGVTFWLGMAVVLGFFLVTRPEDIARLSRLPVALNAALGGAILSGVVAYLSWVAVRPRSLSFQGWTLSLPGLKVSLAQVTLGALDVCAAGAALYILLPQGYGISYGAFIAAYVFACILGIASHAPGGIGVFEATIILALPGIPTEQLLGSLLVFRLIYYIVPFVIALSLLAGREFWHRWAKLRSDIAHPKVANSTMAQAELPPSAAVRKTSHADEADR